MGSRVDAASNEVESIEGHPRVVFCSNCGQREPFTMTRTAVDDNGEEYTYETHIGPQGWAPVDYAEDNWIDVGRELACGIYCAAKVAGYDEKEAQLARSMKTRMDMREQGLEEEADADEQFVNAIAEDPDQFPFIPGLEAVADEDTHEHDLVVEQASGDIDAEFEEIRKSLEGGEE